MAGGPHLKSGHEIAPSIVIFGRRSMDRAEVRVMYRSTSAARGQDCHHSKESFDTLFRCIASRRDLSPCAKLVHGALVSCHRIGKSRTQQQIADMVGLTRHQVWDALQELQAAGLVQIIRIGLGRANEYVLLGIDPSDLKPVKGRKQDSGRSDSEGRRSLIELKNDRKSGNTGSVIAPNRCMGCGGPHRTADCEKYGRLIHR